MNKFCVVLILLGVVSTHAFKYAPSDEKFFKVWTKRHQRSYQNIEEYMKRFEIWLKNYRWIVEMNTKGNSFTVGLNEFADLENEEFRTYYTGYKTLNQEADVEVLSTDSIPNSIDWSKKGAVTGIKNQGECGSCWAFSTTGALEGLNFILNGKLISFSEQQLVDCSGSYGNNGCGGGLMDNAFKYTAKYGIEPESVYGYEARDDTCRYDAKKVAFRNKSYKDVTRNSEEQLKAAVAHQPVSVAVDAGTGAWQLYTGGIMESACGTQLDHGVLAVGYGSATGTEFWKVKNSWGAAWGESGYIRLKRTESSNSPGECGIAMEASYPTGSAPLPGL